MRGEEREREEEGKRHFDEKNVNDDDDETRFLSDTTYVEQSSKYTVGLAARAQDKGFSPVQDGTRISVHVYNRDGGGGLRR